MNSNKRTGGGVLLAINHAFETHELFPPNGQSVEQIWAAVLFRNCTIYIGVAYVPPDLTNAPSVIDQHISSLNWITDLMEPKDNIVLLGDYNLPGIKWIINSSNYLYPDSLHSSANYQTERLLDSFSFAGLCQINGILNENSRILDLCFASTEMVHNATVSEAPSPLVKSSHHHPSLLISLRVSPPLVFANTAEVICYNYSKADFSSMNAFLLNTNWDAIFNVNDVDSATLKLSHVLLNAIDNFVPKKRNEGNLHPPWTNHHLKRLKSIKRFTLRKFSRYRNNVWKSRYVVANNEYRRLNKTLFTRYHKRIQATLKHNPKFFWNYVNDQKNESGLPTVMLRGDTEASNKHDICELFRSQFSSVFVNNPVDHEQIAVAIRNVPHLTSVGSSPFIDAYVVEDACKKLNYSVNPGPDGIPSAILKKCSKSLSLPLSQLFNRTIQSGVFPKSWKYSFVFPVFKKGSKRDVKNYRGIACLCALSKLLEIIVLDFISHACKNYIVEQQHGFVPKRSTSTNLVAYTSFIIRSLQSRQQVDAVYTDFSAAFDTINHRIAIAKLQRLGFNGPFLNWMESYLVGRQMSVKIGSTISMPFRVTSGVPQGSHLGPYIFLLYLNDVNFTLKCFKLSYADDFKLYYPVNRMVDAVFLQSQIDVFYEWCDANMMILNATKCSVISFSRKRSGVRYGYKLLDTTLQRVECIKDLGIILDSKLTFRDHISYITSKASKTLGFVFRLTKHFKDVYCMKALYCALVRSILEYASVVWSPYYQNGIQRIEAVQRKFLKYCLRNLPWRDPLNLPSYENRCNLIDINLLSNRRNVAKASFISDLLQSHIDSPELLRLVNLNIRGHNLRTNDFLHVPLSRTNYGYNEPMSSMCRTFNRCSSVFDFELPRTALKKKFTLALR